MMIKLKMTEKQINSRTLAQTVPCPYNKLTQTNVWACQHACRRYAGIDEGYLLCGSLASNKIEARADNSNPRLHQIMVTFGDNLDYICGAYGKPKG